LYDVLASGQQNSLGINDYSFSLESTMMHYYLSKVELFDELGTEFFMFVTGTEHNVTGEQMPLLFTLYRKMVFFINIQVNLYKYRVRPRIIFIYM